MAGSHPRGVAATTGQTIGVGNCGDIGEYKAPDPKPKTMQVVGKKRQDEQQSLGVTPAVPAPCWSTGKFVIILCA